MTEFIVTRMPYDTLVEEVQANTKSIEIIDKKITDKQDKLINTTDFEVVPVVTRNSDKIQYITVSDGGLGSSTIPRRTKEGNLNLPPETTIPNEGDVAASVNKVNTLIANSTVSNKGIYLPKKPDSSTPSTTTIEIKPKGQYIIRGGNTTIDGFLGDCEFHMIIFFETGGQEQKALHIYQKEMDYGLVKIPSVGSELVDNITDTHLTINSTSTDYGAWIVYEG